MNGWRSTTWGELATLEYGKAIRNYHEKTDGFPVFGTNGQIGFHEEPLCPTAGVVVGRKGAYRGIHYSARPFFVIDTAFFLKPKTSLDVRWAYYQLLNFDINKLDSGSAIPSTSREAFYAIPVELPSIPVQRRIASILSAFDDLIENNTRRIKILEEMAQMLYREWFVHFRFPGHEKVRMVDSELGTIPEGWDVKRVANFGKVVTGKTPSTEHPEYFGPDVPFIKTPDMHGNVFCTEVADHLSFVGAESQASKTIPPNTIIVNCIGALAGSVSITTTPAQTNQQINSVVLSALSSREFLYFSLASLRESLRSLGSNGATMINVNKSKFENLRIVNPTASVVEKFHALTYPSFELLRNLQFKNQVLRATRDLLLPKLISGEISVEAAENGAAAIEEEIALHA